MQFYRRWQPVAAISFDLDDTLYDNGPAIARAEQWMLSHLRSEYLATAMLDKPRWLILNKADLMFEDEARAAAEAIVAELDWKGPWYLVSALGREGTWPIMLAVQAFFDRLREDELEAQANGVSPDA